MAAANWSGRLRKRNCSGLAAPTVNAVVPQKAAPSKAKKSTSNEKSPVTKRKTSPTKKAEAKPKAKSTKSAANVKKKRAVDVKKTYKHVPGMKTEEQLFKQLVKERGPTACKVTARADAVKADATQ